MLVAVVVAIVSAAVVGLADQGVSVVGVVPRGSRRRRSPTSTSTRSAPRRGRDRVGLRDPRRHQRPVPSLAGKRHEQVDPNQEIAALGSANLAAGLFQGFPVSARPRGPWWPSTPAPGPSSPASSVPPPSSCAGGGRRHRRRPALGDARRIVIAAAVSLFDLATLRWLGRCARPSSCSPSPPWPASPSSACCTGIVVAIAAVVADFVRRAWHPYDAELGRLPRPSRVPRRPRHPDAVQIPGLVVYRFDAPIFFANAEFFEERPDAAPRHRHRCAG